VANRANRETETQTEPVRVSRRLIEAVRLSPDRGYVIAHQAALHPSTLSKLINGVERIRPDDARVLAIARVVGVPPEHAFAAPADSESAR
jgi:hypothetical protein